MEVGDICTDALRELGVVNAVDAAGGEDMALAVFRLNRILDSRNAERRGVYASTISTFTLTPSLQPHTIGPTGATWTFATARPEEIEAANLVFADTRSPITLRDKAWWMNLGSPETESDIPTDLYYEKAWPLGKLRFYPVPNAAYEVELLCRVVLAAVAQETTFTLPPGYQEDLTLTLAEDLAAPFRVPAPQTLPMRAAMARARVIRANATTPRICTADAGLPGDGGNDFDYRTRL